MSALNLLNYLVNFVAPAFFVALLSVLFSQLLVRRRAGTLAPWKQMAVSFTAGVAVLVIGLITFGNDGHMATYTALVVVCGLGQWLFL